MPCLHRPHRDQFRFQVASDRDVNHSFASETCGVEEGAAQCRKPITTPEIERPVGCEGKVRAKRETAFIKPKAMISVSFALRDTLHLMLQAKRGWTTWPE